MAQSYTRQSTIADGDTITAALFNNEYNQILNAFTYATSAVSTGHRHDGSAAQGGNIHTIGDLDFLNKIVADSTNNRWGVFVQVSSSAVEQIRFQDGAIVPVTDNDIDLGTSSVEFKDAYFDGTVTADAFAGPLTGAVTGTASLATSVTVSANNSTDETVYPVFVDGATGTQGAETDTGLTYNPSSGLLTITGELDAGSLDISGNADIDGTLEADAYTVAGTTLAEYIADTVGAMLTGNTETNITVTYQDSDNTIDFVSSGTITALNNATENELVTIGSTTTELDAESGLTYDGSVLTVSGEVDATTLDISGNADIDGTLEADAITVDGTALNEYIADTVGAMVGSNTETNITVTYEDGDNTLDFVIGTLNQDTTGNAATFTASANNSTDETVYPVFVDGATGSQGGETDTGLTYNPSTGLLTSTGFSGNLTGTLQTAAQTNITSVGTIGTGVWQGTAIASGYIAADAITGAKIADDAIDSEHYTDGSIDNAHIADNAIDSEHYADGSIDNAHIADDAIDSEHYADGSIDTAHIADNQVTLAKMAGITRGSIIYGNSSGDPAALALGTSDYVLKSDGTDIAWAADAGLSTEQVQDIAGGMMTGNTESGITVTYQDGDGTVDFTVGTLNQDTTGTADNFTATANNSTDETVYPVFVDGATGSQGAETDTGLTYNPSSGLLTTTTVAAALTGNSSTATEATNVTASANNSTDETVYPTFVDGATGTQGIETDTGLTYNPSSGLITTAAVTTTGDVTVGGDLSVTGTTTIVDTVTMNAANAIVFEGATADAYETTLSIVDPTVADKTQYLINQTGYIPLLAAVTTTAISSTPAELNFLDGTTLGTVTASNVVAVDSNLDITAFRNVTLTGELDAATLDISGDADIDGTLEADAITVDGTTLAEYIADTAGAMVSSNTESGITVAYQDGDNTIDFSVDAAQTGITSIYATDLILGEDSQTAIDFGTVNEIDFKVDNAARLTLTSGALYPVTNNQIDLGTSSLEFKDAYFDGTVTADAFAGPITGNLTGTLQTAAQGNVTSVGTLTSLVVDSLNIDGTTIGHTSDTDLLTFASGLLTVAGEVSMTTLDIGGTNITSTAAELNLIDGGTGSTSFVPVAADRLIVNDGGVMQQSALSEFDLSVFTNDMWEVTSTTPTSGSGKAAGYVWYVV